jgi:hypothetical protein
MYRHLSDHIAREVEAAFFSGGSLAPGAAVPGCGCMDCTGVAPAARRYPDAGTIICPQCTRYRDLVRGELRVFYLCTFCLTRSSVEWPAVAVGTQWSHVPRVPAGIPALPRFSKEAEWLREDARGVPVTAAARMLGLELDRTGRYARCPFHDDARPSLHLNDARGRAFCNPCGRSWDSIQLVRELHRCSFAEAITYLAGRKAA